MRTGLAVVMLLLSACVSQTTLDGQPVVRETEQPQRVAAERVALAMAYMERGQYPQAKANLERAEALDPDSESLLLAAALYFEQVGDVEGANQSYLTALKRAPDSADLRNNYGVFLCREKRYEAAQEQLLLAVNQPHYRQQGSTYENLARCALQAGQVNDAERYFGRALKYDPNRTSIWLELAELSLSQKRFDDAGEALAQFHAVSPATASSLWLGVEIAIAAERRQTARHFGARLLLDYPDSKQAKAYRAKNYQ